eukprot:comp8776_c0_seq1/m.4009 comp8776_c0_seq1/g.4009  ORF comp8776_c0_seq1/g.4009 comp8776_c0_seq1/m.4009 type:complete len:313 (+) comp8776_c0_seq1:618-1556(+)
MLVGQFLQHLNGGLPLLGTAIEDVRQHRHNADGPLGTTLLLPHRCIQQLCDLWWGCVLAGQLLAVGDNVAGLSPTLVVLWRILVGPKHLNGGVAPDAIFGRQLLVHGGINCAQPYAALKLGGCCGPVGFKVLAMATPGSKELDHPDVATLHHQLIEVISCQLHHIPLAPLLVPTATTAATTRTLPTHTGHYHISCLPEGCFNHAFGCALAVIVDGLFLVCSKNFDCGETLNAVWCTETLVLVHVHGTNIDHPLQGLGYFGVFGYKVAAVPTPWCVELHQPHAIPLEDLLVEVLRCQVHHPTAPIIQGMHPTG